jgi:hypothetical protein
MIQTELIPVAPADAIVSDGLVLICLVQATAWLLLAARAGRRPAISLALLMVGLVAAAWWSGHSDVFRDATQQPPAFVLLAVVCLSATTLFGLGPVGQRLGQRMSTVQLVALQVFRLPLELLMLRAALIGLMPVALSMLGFNFDVLTGATAGAVWLWLRQVPGRSISRPWLQAWQFLGSALLTTVLVLAVLLSPTVAAFGPGQLNTWVLGWPYSLLPCLLVNLALLGHLVMHQHLRLRTNLVHPSTL